MKRRSLKGYNVKNLQDKRNDINWMEITNTRDVDTAWNRFQSIFLELLDKIPPSKETRIKQRPQAWISNDILDTIHLRNKTLGELKKKKNCQHFLKIIRYIETRYSE